ncbi:hypothetical protein [Nocardia sp. bgisy118]|uniref:hypothetical protein n=1 Tax=Nocardia sp. bgisy118 TaxID=3413786 RepID=UPI003F49F0AB
MNPGPSTGWPRGGLVGALVGLLSAAAHGAAGGGYPDSPESALLLTVSALAGCAATGFSRSSDRSRSTIGSGRLGLRRGDWHGDRLSTRRGDQHSAQLSTRRGEWLEGARRRAGQAHAAAPVLGALAAGQLAGHAVLTGLLGHAHGERVSHIARDDAPLAGFLPTGWMLCAHLLATLACAVAILAAERLYGIVSGAARAILGEPRHLPVARAGRWADHRTPTYRFPPRGPIGPRAPPAFA